MKFVIDEHLGRVLHTVLRSKGLDVVRVQDVNLRTAQDPEILEWAAPRDRVFLTRDRRTVPDFAYERVSAGLPVAGVVVVDTGRNLGDIVEDIQTIAECESLESMRDRVVIHLPLVR